MSEFKACLQKHGWWMMKGNEEDAKGSSPKATHLLLDGGRAHVPDHDADLFLAEYVNALVRHPETPPAAVEMRTPIFRLFMDVDAKFPASESGEGVVATFDFESLWRSLLRWSHDCFEGCTEVIVCRAPPKSEADGAIVKHGIHLVWPEVRVTADMALGFRQYILPKLSAEYGDDVCVNSWADVIDACVYKANGLRMPWSVKGHGGGRAYVPTTLVRLDGTTEAVEVPRGVSAMRAWMERLTIRAFGRAPSLIRLHSLLPAAAPMMDGVVGGGGGGGGAGGARLSLGEYADVLPKLDAALPPEYKPHAFTGAFKTKHNIMLRSTSKYCRNLGRAHNSNTVYFAVSRTGISQRCFCRCETTEGRKYGMCKDFESEHFPVDEAVLRRVFPDEETGQLQPRTKASMDELLTATLPTHKSTSRENLDSLLSRCVKSRGGGATKKKPAARKKKG